ncbi:MAG: hypothetical protein LBK63_07350, partial [Treponema sp.]|nr:hypothetical protein [Treponema sp.]
MGSAVKKSAVLLLAVWALVSCENPIQAGLGQRVDINPPKLSVLSPKAGLFLHDLTTFRISASDDIKVEGVYVRAAMEAEFKANPPDWIAITPLLDEPGIWSWQKTTVNEEDGIFIAQFKVVDRSGKYSETENLVYTIKNLPPRIDLNIPNFTLRDRTQIQSDEIVLARNGFSVDSGGVLLGYASDIQGVAFQSPKIKFWREGEAKPVVWSDVDIPDWDLNGDGVVDALDENAPQAVSKGREFRYYITDHTETDENNRPVDPRLATPLPVGDYRLQLWVSDTGVNEQGQPSPISTIFPPVHAIDGVEYDSILIHVTPSYETPRLEVAFTPNNAYQKESFLARAKASHSAGIESVDLKARKSGDMALHSLKWESDTENLFDVDANGAGVKSRSLESFFIIPGGYYPQSENGTFLFDSGTYEFEVQANSKAGAVARFRQTIYIDNTPPTVQVTQIDPGIRIQTAAWNVSDYAGKAVLQQDAAHNIPEAYVVNGKVTIVVSAKDSNGLGSTTDAGGAKEIRFLRYLLVKTNFANPGSPGAAELESVLPGISGAWNASSNGLNPDLIYDANFPNWTARGSGAWKSGFLDELPRTEGQNDLYSRAIDIITLDTRRIFGPLNPGSPDTGELYLFIAAKDQAGNLASLTNSASAVIGYHLHVDQTGDKPYVKFTDIKDTVNTPAALQGAYDNIMESTVRIRGSLEDDDGILVSPQTVQFKLLREREFLDNIDDALQEVTVPFNAELFDGRKGRSLSFNFSRRDLGAAYGESSLADGVYRLTVLVWDDSNEKDGVASLSNSLTEPTPPVILKPVWFAIDGDSPAFDRIVPQNNEFAGDNFVMELTVSDANGPLHLEIRTPQANGSAPLNLHEKLRYWDLDYLRWISDPANAGKWFNSDPAVGIDAATKFNLGKYGKDRLDALIADPSVPGITGQASLTAVLKSILSDIDHIEPPVTTIAGGKTTAFYRFHIKNIDNNTPPHLTVGLSAQDRFLKKTGRILAVKLDKEKPRIWINNGTADIRWFQGMGAINGIVWDPYAAAEGAMPETTLAEADAAATAARGAVRLMHYKKLRWTGNPLTAPAAPSLPAPGRESAEGWVSVKMEFPDDSKSPWSVVVGDPAAMDSSLGMVEPEGIFTLYLYATDQAGNRGPDNPLKFQSYGVDKSAPVIASLLIGGAPPNPPVDPPHRDTLFTLSGTVSDTFALASFSITQSKDGGTPRDIPFGPALVPGGLTHSWTSPDLPRKADGLVLSPAELASGAHDGVYTYVFTVEDRSGRSSTAQRVVYLDTKKPKVEVSSPPSVDLANPGDGRRAFFVTGRIELNGSAADEAPGTVTRIRYYDAEDTETAPPLLSDSRWKSGAAAGISGTNVWRIALDLPAAAPEGNRRIWIIAEDKMGHRNAQLSYANSASGGGTVTADFFPYAYDKA